jgi:hypothetical protein
MSLSMSPETKTCASAADAVEARLQAIAEMLVHGASQQEILALMQKQWGVSRRTAQDDLHTVRQRLAGEAATEDHLFSLRVAQLQRDKLVGLVLRYVHGPAEDFDPRVVQALASLLTAVRGLLDSRDRTAAEIQHLIAERLARGGKVVPEPEALRPAAPVNGGEPAAVSCANGKSRLRRGRNGAAATPTVRPLGQGASIHRPVVRPPLPMGGPAADLVAEIPLLNRRTEQEIEPEHGGIVAAAAVCAACAGEP